MGAPVALSRIIGVGTLGGALRARFLAGANFEQLLYKTLNITLAAAINLQYPHYWARKDS